VKKCNIYIATTAKGTRQTKACGMYLMEAFVGGKPYTIHEIMDFENISENKATLVLLEKALSRMTENAETLVNTKCEHVFYTLNNGWNIAWEKNGWKKARGKEVKDAEEWQKVTELLHHQTYTVSMESHSYERWMQGELEKHLGGNENV
jgi:ribonuclease HI